VRCLVVFLGLCKSVSASVSVVVSVLLFLSVFGAATVVSDSARLYIHAVCCVGLRVLLLVVVPSITARRFTWHQDGPADSLDCDSKGSDVCGLLF